MTGGGQGPHEPVLRAAARYGLSLASPLVAPQRRFLIFCPGRVGSELLVQLLDAHPEIACDSEILADRRTFPDRYLEFRAVQRSGRGVKAYGAKVIVAHLRYIQPIDDARRWLEQHISSGTALVTLERRNLLHQAVSFSRAHKLGWHHTQGDAPTDGRVELDPLDVAAHLYVLSANVDWFHEIVEGLPRLSLCYEDDLGNAEAQQRAADRVAVTLGLAPMPVRSALTRVAPASLQEALVNYDEVAALIRRTRFADYLDE